MPITDPDWIPPIELTFDVEKPIRSEQGVMIAGNPIAMAAGKSGAPRVEGRALGSVFLGRLVLSGTTEVGINGLDRVGLCRADFAVDSYLSSTNDLEARYSNDNGSTYGAWQAIVQVGALSSDSIAAMGAVTINLQNGAYTASGVRMRDSSGSSESTYTALSESGTHTVPTDCNAFQVRVSAGTGSGSIVFYCLGGIE